MDNTDLQLFFLPYGKLWSYYHSLDSIVEPEF